MRIGHEYFSEIIDNLKRNRLRTFLTGFAVAWGIIFLVILLSIGVGLNRGISKSANAGDTEPNYGIYFGVWMTNLPYQGYPAGRWLFLAESQFAQLQEMVPAIEDITPRFRSWNKITYASQVTEGSVKGIGANYFGHFETRVKMLAGRSINGNDVYNREKTLLISSSDALKLFGTDQYGEALGKIVSVNNVSFTVVGVYEAQQNQSASYMPSSTFTMIDSNDQRIDGGYIYAPTIRSKKDFEAFDKELLKALSSILSFSPDDDQAMYSYSNYVNNEQYNKVVNYFYLFLWIVGLSTLLIGIVGVSNIMLVLVKERTQEIGIRRALGAPPTAIISQILSESFILTFIAGVVGLTAAVGVLSVADSIYYQAVTVAQEGAEISWQISFGTGMLALFILVAGSLLAGVIPAYRALSIKAVDAIREE